MREARGGSSKFKQTPAPDAIYLSIYKTREDWEAVQQHSISSITDCSVQMIAHRKQGPVIQTLILQISPDPATDKLRKRRSSRTAGLTTTKDHGPTTLYFRPGDDQYNLNDWARCITSLIQPGIPGNGSMPMSPITPISPTFTNPFAAKSRDASEFSNRPSSGKQDYARPPMTHSQSSQLRSSRDRPATFSSESPSLKSRRSDLSSHASSVNTMGMGYVIPNQHYTTVLPTDLPSPATTVGEYQGEYMLGWTAAQGRSSTLSSPIRGRGSVSSQGQPVPYGQPLSSSPPLPRETILDRAFQMRRIPGSERETLPGEEKLTSLARFEALMREAEEQRRKEKQNMAQPAMASTWEEDEETEEDDLNDAPDDEDSTDDDAFEEEVTGDRNAIGPSTQRGLHYLSNRHSSVSQIGRTSLSFHADSRAYDGGSSILRPQTAHSKMRPVMSPRTSSQPQVPISPLQIPPSSLREDAGLRPHHEKRHSTSSVKRLSFNDFTKRLSSTSSLLLVQTNQSNGSSRGSSEFETQQTTPRNETNPRSTPRPSRQDQDKCNWRGSVGVFGGGDFI